MDTSILYQECDLKIDRAFHEYHEACREREIRMSKIDMALMESTIDEYQMEVLYEDAQNGEKKQGIIATIFQAILDLIKAVIDAIVGIFKNEQVDEKCKDIQKLGEQTDVKVNSADYKKQQKALEKYTKRMEVVLRSGKDAEWIEREQKKAEEQYHKDLKSNFNPKAVLIPLGVLGAAAAGFGIYLKASGKNLKDAVADVSSRMRTNSMVKAMTKGQDPDTARATIAEMERAQERKVRAIQNASRAATRNLERTTEALTRSINRTIIDINMDKYNIARTTKTGKPIDWFKNKWYHLQNRRHNARADKLQSEYNRTVNSFNSNPDVIAMGKEEVKNVRMLNDLRAIHDKQVRKTTGMQVVREPLTIDYIKSKFKK